MMERSPADPTPSEHRTDDSEYRLLFDSNPNPMWVYDRETFAFLTVNEAAVHHYGYTKEEFLTMTIRDIRPADQVPELLRELSAPNPDPLNPVVWQHRKKNGTIIQVEITAQPTLFRGRPASLVLAHDVSKRIQLEQQLRQSQRLDAIGRLAAGIAHDFNNILSVIMGTTELALQELEERSTVAREDLEGILEAARRAATLTRQILAFGRKQVLTLQTLNLNELVSGMDQLLRRTIREDITLECRLAPDLASILADKSQVEQVLLNLVVNARDAMPRGGQIRLETCNAEVDAEYVRQHAQAVPGQYVVIVVSDSGIGMTAEQQVHIFEPFYTTKPMGDGTGLGLSTVYGIVKQSGGFIWVYSEPGRGSTFKVYLPAVLQGDASTAPRPVISPAAVKPRQSTETILLVEDDESVRRIARRILSEAGYRVVIARDPEEAVRFCADHAMPFDLVLSDVVMPGTNGFDLSLQLLAVRPSLRVLMMSGYAGSTIGQLGELKPGMAFIEKPFTAKGLLERVGRLLDLT
jgi:two-component system cell cycle sensor histidine kinase/response regulator CckA